jgi:hypothetical protein
LQRGEVSELKAEPGFGPFDAVACLTNEHAD